MGGIMIRFVIAAFISILTIKGAFADINVFIAPNDLNYETNSTSEFKKYRGDVCKISITTGNTAPSDPVLTQVFTYDELADNKKQSCQKLNNELIKKVAKDKGLSYPKVVKDYGSLSIDMIFLFK